MRLLIVAILLTSMLWKWNLRKVSGGGTDFYVFNLSAAGGFLALKSDDISAPIPFSTRAPNQPLTLSRSGRIKLRWTPYFERLKNAPPFARTRYTIILPLWIPFLIAGIPTAFLWWRDGRIPKGHCQKCGYSLTGNKSGVCPECGTPISSQAKAPAR